MQTSDGAELSVVSDEDTRGAEIRARRMRLFKSQSAAVRESETFQGGRFKISRDAIMAAEKGKGTSFERLDAFYDAFEEEGGQDDGADSPATGLVTFTVSKFGTTATVQGPISDHDALLADAKELMREAMRNSGNTPE